MSEAVKSTVAELEEDLQDTAADTGDFNTTDGHTPIGPGKKKPGQDDLTTTDGHTPIAPGKAGN